MGPGVGQAGQVVWGGGRPCLDKGGCKLETGAKPPPHPLCPGHPTSPRSKRGCWGATTTLPAGCWGSRGQPPAAALQQVRSPEPPECRPHSARGPGGCWGQLKPRKARPDGPQGRPAPSPPPAAALPAPAQPAHGSGSSLRLSCPGPQITGPRGAQGQRMEAPPGCGASQPRGRPGGWQEARPEGCSGGQTAQTPLLAARTPGARSAVGGEPARARPGSEGRVRCGEVPTPPWGPHTVARGRGGTAQHQPALGRERPAAPPPPSPWASTGAPPAAPEQQLRPCPLPPPPAPAPHPSARPLPGRPGLREAGPRAPPGGRREINRRAGLGRGERPAQETSRSRCWGAQGCGGAGQGGSV